MTLHVIRRDMKYYILEILSKHHIGEHLKPSHSGLFSQYVVGYLTTVSEKHTWDGMGADEGPC